MAGFAAVFVVVVVVVVAVAVAVDDDEADDAVAVGVVRVDVTCSKLASHASSSIVGRCS